MSAAREKKTDGLVARKLRQVAQSLLAIAIGLTITACEEGTTDQTFSEQITHEQVRLYLLEHPELVLDDPEIINSISRARLKREQKIVTFERESVLEGRARLLNSPLTPSFGDTGSAVTLIEFYDYQCSPCKASYPELEQMRATETDVRIVYGQLPIFGSHSTMAARAAIAAHRQGLFEAYHAALMTAKTRLDMNSIFAMAADVGLDLDKLRTDMRDPQVIQYLEEMRLFAEALEITGTPAFIVGNAMLRGGTTVDELKVELGRQRAMRSTSGS